MVLGHWLEMRAISQARGALNALAALLPDTAERVTGGEVQTVPLSELKVGDVVLVRPGTRVPADGAVVEGAADVDESMITGESKAVSKGPGAQRHCGNGRQWGEPSSPRYGSRGADRPVRHHAAGRRSASFWISHASSCRPRRRNPFLRGSRVWRDHVHSTGGLSGDKEHALIRTATVLIIACPHALGLAIPLVIAISTSLGAQNGLLVKDRLALERARNLDMVIFDKTGTLTRGSPAVSGIAAAPGTSESDLLALAAAVEANSEHPLAKAIVERSHSAETCANCKLATSKRWPAEGHRPW